MSHVQDITDRLDDPLSIADGVWSVDPQRSEIGFAVKSMYGLVTVRGRFGVHHGSLTVDAGRATGELSIDAASLDTRNARRDRHLRSSDFLDVESHPRIVFTATTLAARDHELTIAGELTVGAAVLPLTLPIAVRQDDSGAIGLGAGATVSRAAVGITWNWLGAIGDDVRLDVRLRLARATP